MRCPEKFIVFSSPLEKDDEKQYETCFILVETQDKIAEFADYLEKNTLLSVDSYVKKDRFYFTFGSFLFCTVLEVHFKEEETAKFGVNSLVHIAIAETYSYLSRLATEKE